ncbi:MAG: hypothetical protein M0C28_33820 [Candidatus Moduliflexus flocculans]|nr:hypothetical protein [Candidatus Moduliflexus flocculans]
MNRRLALAIGGDPAGDHPAGRPAAGTAGWDEIIDRIPARSKPPTCSGWRFSFNLAPRHGRQVARPAALRRRGHSASRTARR